MQADPPKEHPDPCVMVVYGASGDLVARKIVPALFELRQEGSLPDRFALIGVSRSDMTDQSFRDHLLQKAKDNGSSTDASDDDWQEFTKCIHYCRGNGAEPDIYPKLSQRIREVADAFDIVPDAYKGQPCPESPWQGCPNTLFYLSVAPGLYEPIVNRIGEAGLVHKGGGKYGEPFQDRPWQRIIIEKPIGHDLESALELNNAVGQVFDERAVYRIDHYLGKELVQNILVMRFANTIFEPLWSNRHVDHIQVTAAESVGVGRRAGNFYDNAGATRDMLQSHLLQVMALVAMEAPSEYSPDAIRREKVKVLDSVVPPDPSPDAREVVLGTYGPSNNHDDEDAGLAYHNLEGVDPAKKTETFAAMRLRIDNWRWAGTPFYIRSGKKMRSKLTEVTVQFKRPPANLFKKFPAFTDNGGRPGNRIVINIAPDEGIGLCFEAKIPGRDFRAGSVKADFDYNYVFNSEPIEAYGPLLIDCMRGDKTLFKHRDEVEGAWRIVNDTVHLTPEQRDLHRYDAGSWGPEAANDLFLSKRAHDIGGRWHNPSRQDIR